MSRTQANMKRVQSRTETSILDLGVDVHVNGETLIVPRARAEYHLPRFSVTSPNKGGYGLASVHYS